MGKGTIISGGTDGLYQLQINYNKEQYNAQIAKLNAYIADINTSITAKEDEITSKDIEILSETDQKELNRLNNELDILIRQKSILQLKKLSYEKRITYLQNNSPTDITVSAWCADFTQNITGVVGTVEAPGYELSNNGILIKPGYNGAAWAESDKQLTPEVSMSPNQSYYNRAVLPAVEKWIPRYRFGTITEIDGNYASVTLETAISSQQNLNINRIISFNNVLIQYMNCNGDAFSVGDDVLIKFFGNEWTQPIIIGFKSNPKECQAEDFVSIPANNGWSYFYQDALPGWNIAGEFEVDTSVMWIAGGDEYNNPNSSIGLPLGGAGDFFVFPPGLVGHGIYWDFGIGAGLYMNLSLMYRGFYVDDELVCYPYNGTPRIAWGSNYLGQKGLQYQTSNCYLGANYASVTEHIVLSGNEMLYPITRTYVTSGLPVQDRPAYPASFYNLSEGSTYYRFTIRTLEQKVLL